jgi:hypothetical protein
MTLMIEHAQAQLAWIECSFDSQSEDCLINMANLLLWQAERGKMEG